MPRLIDADALMRYYIDKLNFFPALVRRAIENAPTVELPIQWISLKDRPPTEKDADHLGFIIAYSKSMGRSTVCTWHHILDDGVTSHWMPMPQLPKEDK